MRHVEEGLVKEFRVYGKKFEKSLQLIRAGKVKRHRFSPSGREIWTVVGHEGDQLVLENQPYCSCRHFHYRVLGGLDDTCHHLLGVKIAKRTRNFDSIEFRDEEYSSFLRSLLKDFG